MHTEEHIPLAPFTTFKLGGPARYFVRVRDVEALQEAFAFARGKNLKTFILGGGSNVLFADEGFDGLVIKLELKGIEEKGGLLIAAAGEEWDALVARAATHGLWGIENLSGIPGTVGAAPVQNIGAYGAALSQTLEWVEVLDCRSGEVMQLKNAWCDFNYRDSLFKREDGRWVVLRVALRLSPEPAPVLSYKDLAARFTGEHPTLADIRQTVLEIRRDKFPDLSQEGTAGSFFKNPIVSSQKASELRDIYPGLPLFPLPESAFIKVPLGWFLDYRHGVLDLREVRVGGARMYEKQFLVLVVQHNSSASDVKALAALVQEKIRSALGIEIEPEVRLIDSGAK